MSVTSDRASERPLRVDAARNHRAIVAAAREALEQDGPEVPLEEVARRAGVGASTLYRRFAGRRELVEAVFEEYFTARIEPLFVHAAGVADPWEALVGVLEGMVDTVVRQRSLLHATRSTGALTPDVTARTFAPLDDLVARGRAAGVLRPEIEARDLPRIVLMAVVTTGPWDGDADPRVWPRYLALLLDGLRPAVGTLPRLVEPGCPDDPDAT